MNSAALGSLDLFAAVVERAARRADTPAGWRSLHRLVQQGQIEVEVDEAGYKEVVQAFDFDDDGDGPPLRQPRATRRRRPAAGTYNVYQIGAAAVAFYKQVGRPFTAKEMAEATGITYRAIYMSLPKCRALRCAGSVQSDKSSHKLATWEPVNA